MLPSMCKLQTIKVNPWKESFLYRWWILPAWHWLTRMPKIFCQHFIRSSHLVLKPESRSQRIVDAMPLSRQEEAVEAAESYPLFAKNFLILPIGIRRSSQTPKGADR